MMSKIKTLNLAISLTDIHLISYYLNGVYYYEDILSTKTEKNPKNNYCSRNWSSITMTKSKVIYR